MKKITFLLLFSGITGLLSAQKTAPDYPAPVTFTAKEDHDNMMKQLGITEIRPGFSGNENDPNHANYDEALANPCPELPDILTLKNGKKVTLNRPFRTPGGPKKSAVYVKDGGKVKIVRFGDPNMSIKKDIPARRKSFRARHNCANPGPKTKARYWSCKAW